MDSYAQLDNPDTIVERCPNALMFYSKICRAQKLRCVSLKGTEIG